MKNTITLCEAIAFLTSDEKDKFRPVIAALDGLSGMLGRQSNYEALILQLSKQSPIVKHNLVPALMIYLVARIPKKNIRNRKCVSTIPNHQSLMSLLSACQEHDFSFFSKDAGGLFMFALQLFPSTYFIYEAAGISNDDLRNRYHAYSYATLSPFFLDFLTIAYETGASPNVRDSGPFQNSPAHNCIANEQHGMLQELLDGVIENTNQNIDLTVQDAQGKTAALLACKMRDDKALSILIEFANKYPDRVKLDMHVADNEGLTCLHYACLYKSSSLINLLSPAEQDAKRKCTQGPLEQRTPVELLLFQFDEVVFQCLSSVSMRKREIFEACQSPVSCQEAVHEMEKSAGAYMLRFLSAKKQDLSSILDLLGSARTNMHSSGASGNTALHFACRAGNKKHVQWLLAHGANARLRNAKGELSAERATTKSMRELLHAPTYHSLKQDKAAVCQPCTPS